MPGRGPRNIDYSKRKPRLGDFHLVWFDIRQLRQPLSIFPGKIPMRQQRIKGVQKWKPCIGERILAIWGTVGPRTKNMIDINHIFGTRPHCAPKGQNTFTDTGVTFLAPLALAWRLADALDLSRKNRPRLPEADWLQNRPSGNRPDWIPLTTRYYLVISPKVTSTS